MSILYRADRALGCTIAIWDGDITGEDARKHLVRLASDPNWPPGPLHLADLTTTTTVAIPEPELVELLFEGSNLAKELSIAVVVRSEFLGDANARYDTSMGVMNAATFTDLDAACAYLELDSREVAAVIEDLRRGS
jgi:hypothetical protein